MNIILPGLELVNKFYKLLIEENKGRKGTQALILVLEKMNNCEIPKYNI
jgi:hypothetical protein